MSIFSKEFWDKMEASVNLTHDTVSTLLQIKEKRKAMSQQDNKPFQWDDETAKKLCEYVGLRVGRNEDIKQQIDLLTEAFKSSHSSSEKVDWEILAFKPYGLSDFSNEKRNDDGTFGQCRLSEKWLLGNRTYSIHSVRRLADRTEWKIGEDTPKGNILRFELAHPEGNMYVHYDLGGWDYLNQAKKAPIPEEKPTVKPPIGIIPEWLWKEQRIKELESAINRYDLAGEPRNKEWVEEYSSLRNWIHNHNHNKPKASVPEEKPVLFTTEDGKEVFKGSTVWYIPRDCSRIKEWVATKIPEPLDGSFIYFSSQELANEYVIMNKPCLSIRDVQSTYGDDRSFVGTQFLVERLKQLASSKIEGGK